MDHKLKELFDGAGRKADRVIFDKKIDDIKRGIKHVEEIREDRKRNPNDYDSLGNLTPEAKERRFIEVLGGPPPDQGITEDEKQKRENDFIKACS